MNFGYLFLHAAKYFFVNLHLLLTNDSYYMVRDSEEKKFLFEFHPSSLCASISVYQLDFNRKIPVLKQEFTTMGTD